jgi:F-type H+-transporting ATPase subunit b
LIFLYVINRIMFRPLIDTMAQRNDYIDEITDDILSGKGDLDQIVKDLDRQRVKVIKGRRRWSMPSRPKATGTHLR